MQPRLPILAFVFALLLATESAPADEPWPSLFDPFRVQTIYIQIDPQKWNAILHDTNFYDQVLNVREPCQLWMSGDTAPNSLATSLTVQIRRKSDAALPSEANPQKVSLKIDINEFVPGQSIRGVKKLSLENGGGSNGILKEGFAMNMHRMAADAGFHHWNFGNASWVRLVVNDGYVGLYMCPEQRDVSFLKNRGMYKQGASWLYEVNGSLTRDDSVNTTDSPTHTHLNYYPFRGPNAAPGNFEQDVSEWVAMRSMLTMASIEAFIANTDGLFTKSASNQGKNSFLVDWLPSLQAQRTYLPWDLDGGFANTTWDIFAGGSGQQSSRRYQTQILQHAWFGEMYRHTFSELLDGPLSSAAMNAWLDQWETAVGPALAEDPNADAGQVASPRGYIAARIPNIRTQIGAFIKPPSFAPGAGEIADGFSFALTHPNTTGTSTIYYTTDGTDPRAHGGGVGASAVAYTSAVALAQSAHVLSRVRNVNGATTRWSNLREGTFNVAAPTADAPIPFALSQDGESVYLASADGAGNLTGHIVGQKFSAAENNVAQGRIAGGDFAALTAQTFGVSAPVDRPQFRTGTGAANAAPRVGPVVFSEINYQPDAGGTEFIELLNTSAAAVALDGWSIEGAAYIFPAGTSIAAGGLLVVADTLDAAAYRVARGIPARVPVLAATFDLGDAGESLELLKPNADPLRPPIRIERVRYNDKAPWPTEAAGRGLALERISATQFGNDPLNWHTAAPAGSPGFFTTPMTSTVIARGSGWNYDARGRDLGSAWRGAAYSDSAWLAGRAGIGFGTATTTTLLYANPKPITTWLRKKFAIAEAPAAIATLTASVNYNDGFIAYLNGTEVARRSLPASVTATTPATPHPHGTFEPLDLTPFKNLLTPSANVLAIELHLASETDTDAYFDADLAYTRTTTNPDTDRDGIPEAWELAYGLNPSDTTDAALDADADGQSNLAEYLAGTDPRDAASVFKINGVESPPSGCRRGLHRRILV